MPDPVPPLPPLPDDWERALAIVAHPDDLEYGAASAVARWTSEGRSVAYLLVTRGEAGIDGVAPAEAGPLREAEERRAAAEVGVDQVDVLDHRDGVVEGGLALRRDLAAAIRRRRPQLLVTLTHRLAFAGGFANQADHRAVGLATLDAARDAGNRWIFPELGLEPWGGVGMVAFAGSPVPTHAVDVTGHLERGVASLRAHRIYLEHLGDDGGTETFVREAAEAAGRALGVGHAVTFEVLRV